MTKKIAFCFLIYDIINHEEIWNRFFKNVDTEKYSIYIHYKYDKKMKYFEKYKLDNCIETKYADVTLIHAHNLLFEKAYNDGCYKIISLSGACIPLKPFNYVYDFLTKDNYGHFNIAQQESCFPRCNGLLNYYKYDNIQKSSNWFILNRNTCNLILSYDKNRIDNEFGEIISPEEHSYITIIYENNLQHEIITTPNLANGATTFTNWADMDYKYVTEKGLKNYDTIELKELKYLMKSKSLFGRKFYRECTSLINKTYLDFISTSLT
jgi:hypothetical protein